MSKVLFYSHDSDTNAVKRYSPAKKSKQTICNQEKKHTKKKKEKVGCRTHHGKQVSPPMGLVTLDERLGLRVVAESKKVCGAMVLQREMGGGCQPYGV